MASVTFVKQCIWTDDWISSGKRDSIRTSAECEVSDRSESFEWRISKSVYLQQIELSVIIYKYGLPNNKIR